MQTNSGCIRTKEAFAIQYVSKGQEEKQRERKVKKLQQFEDKKWMYIVHTPPPLFFLN